MKKITLLLVCILTSCLSFSQTTLSVGDIAFIGSNADGTTNVDDTVAFVLLKDIDASTQIIFTDRGWNDGSGFSSYAGDGEFTWTSGAAMSAGTVVTINMGPLPSPAVYSIIGDQLFAIQGSIAAPQFIAGLQYNDTSGDDANWDGAATSNSTSALPDALTTGVTAVRLVPEQDNWQFSCAAAGGAPISGTPNDIRLIVNNRANWVSNNSTPYTPPVESGCTFNVTAAGDTTPPVITCAPTPAPITAGNDGLAAIPDLVTGTTATDDVSSPSNITITQSPAAGTMYYPGVYPVILTATDEAGNSATCTINVTINEPPSTTLTAGDIAFVGFNLDGSDGFAFILLKDIIAGTHIRFTDCGVTNPNTISCNGSGDGSATWYSSTARSAGDIVSLDGSFMASSVLSSIGDQLFAYQGTSSSPTFITGIHSNVDSAPTTDADWDGANTSSTTTALPDQLTNGVNAIRLYAAGPPETEVDNWQFNCSLVPGGLPVSGTPAQLAAIFNDIQYWSSNNTVEFTPAAMTGCTYAVLPPFDTEVTLAGGVLLIEDIIDKDDDLIISYSGGIYTITDNNGGIINCSIPGATGSGTSTITVPDSGVTSVLARTLGGDDLLTVDFTGNFPVPLNYEGGTQTTGDALTLTGGGTFTDVTHEFLNENDGNIDITGNASISYTGLEPIIDNLSAINRVFSFIGAAETISLSDDANPGDGFSFIDSDLGENVTFINPTASLTINTEASGGTGADIVNIEGLDSLFDANLTVNGGADDNVFFQTNATNIGTGNYDINAQTITATNNVTTTANGAIVFTASQNILVDSGAIVSSIDGNITLDANAGGTLTGVDTDAIVISGASTILTSGSGNIAFTGTGVSTGPTNLNVGINIRGASVVENTGTGTISITGTGGNGNNQNQGMRFEGAGTRVTTIDGGITLHGTGGNAATTNNEGVTIIFGALVEATGTGIIDVTGNSVSGTDSNKAIVFYAGNMRSAGGGINLNGVAAGTNNSNDGVTLENNSVVEDTSNGNIFITGIGAPGANANIGVDLNGGSILRTNNGNIDIIATGGNGTGSNNRGLRNIAGSLITSTGSGAITITSNAGTTGVTGCFGYEANDGSIITAGGGIIINAQGNGSDFVNDGIVVLNGSVIQDTANGAIQLTGTGGSGGISNNNGIRIWDATTLVETNNGDILLNGTGGDGTGNFNQGVSIYNGAILQSLGAGNVTIFGVGGAGDQQNRGINFEGGSTSILTNGGNISLTGIGSSGSTGPFNVGTSIRNGATLSTTGAGNIVLNGTSGAGSGANYGLEIVSPVTSVNTGNGNITITGTSTATSGSSNFGTFLDAIINAGGTGNIEINGSGGNGTSNDMGIYTLSNAAITSNGGSIQFDGTSSGVTTPAIDIAALTTPITTSGNITATANVGKLNTPAGLPGYAIFDAANSTINGIFAPGQSPGQAIINGNLSIGSGDSVEIEIDDINTPGTEFDQIVVNGAVDITNASLSLIDNFAGTIPEGNTLIIIDNDGADPIVGEFNGLPNGTGFTFNGQSIIVNYDGGDGNDVVLVADSMPTAVCQDITVQLDGTGNVSITASQVDGGSSDPDGPVTLSIDISSFDCSNIGPNNVTLTVTDGTGNTDSCIAVVTVEDNEAPVITCVPNDSRNTDPGVCSYTVIGTEFDATFTDNCPSATITNDYNGTATLAGETLPSGTTTVVWTVDDGNGQTATCSTDITVVDNQSPVITCVANQTRDTDPGVCNYTVVGTEFDATFTDNCGGTIGNNYNGSTSLAGAVFPIGSTTVVWAVFDGTNPVVFCQTIITIEDNEAPVITCVPNATRDTDAGVCSYTVVGAEFDATFTDNCTSSTLTNDYNGTATMAGAVLPKGVTTVVWTVDDGNGQTATCTTIITVEDNEAPVITCVPNATRDTDAGVCSYTVVGAEFDATFTDNCTDGSITNDYNGTATMAGEVLPKGVTTVIWTVDDGNGQTATCTTVITVEDNEAPVITCVPNATRDTDPGVCNYTVVGTEFDATFTDNCPSATMTNDYNGTATMAGAVLPKGVTTVIWTVDDGNGQTATCTTVITVEDNEAPVITCVPNATRDTDPGVCSYTVVGTEFDATFTDNCTDGSITNDYNGTATMAGEVLPKGVTTVIWTVDDGNGQTATCTTIITVEDNEAPVITCAPNATRDTDPGVCDYTVVGTEFDATFTDNCTDGSITNDYNGTATMAGAVLPKGVTTVIWTVDDGNGQTATCTTVITVEDNEAPVITCVPNATRDTDPGVCNYTVVGTEFDATFTDNCPDGSITNDYNGTATMAGEVLPKGVTTVVWTVDDGNGQTATCTTVITVEDNEAPVITCVPNATRDTEPGLCEYTVVGTEFDATFTDNCPDGSITNDYNGTATMAGEVLPTGDTTVVWTVDDGNGQIVTCTTVITIEDNELPTIICPADITANTDAGQCYATVTFATPVAFDNCGIDSVVQTMGDPSGSGFPVGVNVIEFTATDVNGNTSTCSFTITVTDNEAPVAVCQNITVQLDATGNATITAADVDGGSTDQCGIDSLSIDVDTFDCSDVGDNNVILTVTDVNGNTSTCTAIVTVEDVTAPMVVCQDITVVLDATGTVTIAGVDVDGGSTDACGIASYDLDIDTFDCSNVGDNIVTLTVTDVNGNSATCTATVTVEDNTSPVLVCQDFTLELGADGTAILDPSDVIASNDDACGIFTSAVDITDFDCSDIGAPVTVQVFTIDVNGNLATCTAEVTVVDNLAPVITCPADQTVDPGPGNIFYILPDYFATGEATAIDNCTDPVTITSQSPVAGTPLPDGVHTITLTATDAYGNTSTCEFELTVESVLGAEDNNQNFGSVKIYPVPTNNILNISNPQSLELERLEIYDLRGRIVQSADLRGMGNVKTINVDQLAAASYYVKIKGANGEITKRLIKE